MNSFHSSSFRNDGFRDGYAAVSEPRDPTPPDHPAHRAEYMEGWEQGVREGRADWEYDRAEREYMDWRAGL